MLATGLIIVGLLLLVVSLAPLVLDLTGHIKYIPAGSDENWFKQTLTGDITKYIMLGTGIFLGLGIVGSGIWLATRSSKTDASPTSRTPITPITGYQKIPTQYGSIPRSGPSNPTFSRTTKPLPQIPSKPPVFRQESVEDWPPASLSRVNTPQSEYADPSAWLEKYESQQSTETLKRRSAELKAKNNPESPYGFIPDFKTLKSDGYGKIPESLQSP